MSDRELDGGVLGRRIAAFVVDTALVVGVCYATASRAATRWRRAALTGALAAVLGFVYHVALEGLFGQTVGKRACGIVVVGANGEPCSLRAALVRTAGRFVDALPVGYLVGLAAIALSPRDRRIGDYLAGTVVVRTEGAEDDRGE